MIYSRVRDFNRRKKIRSSWGNATNFPNLQVGYVVGEESEDLYAEDIMKLAREEAYRENDTLLVPYHDTWRNISYKNLASLDFFTKNCKDVPVFMRVDDDYPLLLRNILSFVKSIPLGTDGILGYVLKNRRPKRDPMNRYYIPKKIYNQSMYPHFVAGQALVITARIIPILFKGLLHTRYDSRLLDDQLLSMVAREAGIKSLGVTNFTAKVRDENTDDQDWSLMVYD